MIYFKIYHTHFLVFQKNHFNDGNKRQVLIHFFWETNMLIQNIFNKANNG